MLWLIDSILASGDGVLSEAYEIVYFPGDDLFACAAPARPADRQPDQPVLGQLSTSTRSTTSSSANCAARAYLRYVDDFLLFAPDKATLWALAGGNRETVWPGCVLSIHPAAAASTGGAKGFRSSALSSIRSVAR
ncbi:MAG: hypothetical protein V9G10_13530 [Candidatus Nanopelagicales bacterium]